MGDKAITICVTAYNEENNLAALHNSVAQLRDRFEIDLRLTIVDNGSQDKTLKILRKLFTNSELDSVLHLDTNRRFGGGMLHAIENSNSDIVCLLPADNQYNVDDISRVLKKYIELSRDYPKIMAKGKRSMRDDPKTVKLLSFGYSRLSRLILGVPVEDINGLPKIFNKEFLLAADLRNLPSDAVFDAALLMYWQMRGGLFMEVPVRFLNRTEGFSSWSGGKYRIAVRMANTLLQVRKLLVTRTK